MGDEKKKNGLWNKVKRTWRNLSTKVRLAVVLAIIIVISFISIRVGASVTQIGGSKAIDLKKIGKLETLEYFYKDYVYTKKDQEFKILWFDIDPGEVHHLVEYQGRMILGINLENVDYKEVRPTLDKNRNVIKRGKLTIWLPEVEILASELVRGSIKEIMYVGKYTKEKIDITLFAPGLEKRIIEHEQEILESDMTRIARENAKSYIEGILNQSSLFAEQYDITWK